MARVFSQTTAYAVIQLIYKNIFLKIIEKESVYVNSVYLLLYSFYVFFPVFVCVKTVSAKPNTF